MKHRVVLGRQLLKRLEELQVSAGAVAGCRRELDANAIGVELLFAADAGLEEPLDGDIADLLSDLIVNPPLPYWSWTRDIPSVRMLPRLISRRMCFSVA